MLNKDLGADGNTCDHALQQGEAEGTCVLNKKPISQRRTIADGGVSFIVSPVAPCAVPKVSGLICLQALLRW